MLIPQEGIHCERELDNQKKKKKHFAVIFP